MAQQKGKPILVLAVVGLTAAAAVAWSQSPPEPNEEIAAAAAPAPQPSPGTSTSQITPDGSRNAKLEVDPQKVDLYVDGELYFTSRRVPGSEMVLPFNTWSPDNKDLFMKQTVAGEDDYLVFLNAGAEESEAAPLFLRERFLDIYPENEIASVPGWAAPQLLIVNMRDKDGDMASLWFNVKSERFIPLASGFY